MPKLLIKTGKKKGSVYQLHNQEVSIGRGPSNMIALPDRRVSREHARIVPHDKEYIIEDRGSINRTLVNNSPITKQILKLGDEIKLGGTILAFLSLGPPEEVEVKKGAHQVKVVSGETTSKGLTVEMVVKSEEVGPLEAEVVKPDVKTLQKAYQRLMVLYRISYGLGSLLEMPKLLDGIMELVLEIMEADRGFIMLVDEETGELIPQVTRKRKGLEEVEEITVSSTITNRVVETGESILTSDAMRDERFKEAQSVVLHGIRSAMCVPIKAKEKILGIMYVDTKAKVVGFAKDDLELLTAICRQAGVVVENAKLFYDLKKANQELKEQQDQLIESEKLAALGQLAGGVAHEINNPLTSIISYAELSSERLAAGMTSPEELKKSSEFLKIVRDNGYHCQKIAKDLLQFARRKKAEMVPADVNKVIESTLVMARYHMKKVWIKMVMNLNPDLPQITGNSDQLQQVFLNMIINARDAMGKGGTLTITTSKIEDKWVEVKFTDTGCGIPLDLLEEIFKPLYTTKGEGKGTGLGLSISQEIIERHKGTIDVESTVGKGTAFIIRLPLIAGD
ncbi:MAG: GAF domain-containing protein [Candidatus Omnitrophica bacterium]|nr:GAF domain-containing protein [Candidatus Omnitrophota bacterium]